MKRLVNMMKVFCLYEKRLSSWLTVFLFGKLEKLITQSLFLPKLY